MQMVSCFSWVDVDGVPVLMSALEQESFGQKIRDAHPIDKALKTVVVYGGYIPCRSDRRQALADMRAAKGKTVGLVWADLCRWASLEDIQIFTPEDDGQKIPFAALMRTTEWMPGLMGSALAYFVRYPSMSVRTNILTRRGIFAVKTSHQDYYRRAEGDFRGHSGDWRSYVKECEAHQARDFARLAYSYPPDGAKPGRRLAGQAGRTQNGGPRG